MSMAHLIIGPSEYLIEKWNGGWRFGKYETTKDGKKRIFEWSIPFASSFEAHLAAVQHNKTWKET